MLKYNAQMVGLGVVVFVFGALFLGSLGAPPASVTAGERAGFFAMGAVGLLAAAGALVLLVRLRRRRREWMRAHGRYESLGVFEAELREAAGVREDLKGYILGKLGEPLQEAAGGAISVVRELLERDSLGSAYIALQKKRQDGSITEAEFRAAIDALFEASRPSRR